jgi:serine/threonine-protein kinase
LIEDRSYARSEPPRDPAQSGVINGRPRWPSDRPPSKLAPPPLRSDPAGPYPFPRAAPVPAFASTGAVAEPPLPAEHVPVATSSSSGAPLAYGQASEEGSTARLVLVALASVIATTVLVVAGYVYATRDSGAAKVAPAPSASASAQAPLRGGAVGSIAPMVAAPPPSITPSAPVPSASSLPLPSPQNEPPRRRPSNSPKRASCDNPFYVDREGIKHIRPECM